MSATGKPISIILKLWHLIRSEPYRLFFALGWLAGLVGVTYWLLVSTGIASNQNPLIHGLIQIELFAAAFATGFLLTALPKFLRTPSATNVELICILGNYFILAATLLCGFSFIAQVLFIALILQIVRFAWIRFQSRKTSPPDSFFLVGFGLLQGALGALVLVLPCPIFPNLGQRLLEQGMLLSLSLGIGSFLGPRLMGIVDVANIIVRTPGSGKPNLPWRKDPRLVVFIFGTLIVLSFLIEAGANRDLGIYLRATTATICLYHFGVLKLPRTPSIVGVLVAIALWAMVLGQWLAAVSPQHEVSALHITYIGGFGLLILVISAQVASSHGGEPLFWAKHRAWAIPAAALVILATTLRAFATVYSSQYFLALGASALCFDIALILWGIGLLKHLYKTSDGS